MPFEAPVRAEILRLAGGGAATAADFCRMNFLLGKLYCEAGLELCRRAGVAPENIDLIGNHGQTFWHIPVEEEYLGRRIRSTLQLGGDALLAEQFGCPVVGDFRVRDMAAGGLGAPLVPYTEFLLYRSETECVALQNIGGIGNISFLPAGCGLNDVLAFDTGPGNMVIDALTAQLTGGAQSYDDGGRLAGGRPRLTGAAGLYAGRRVSAPPSAQDHRAARPMAPTTSHGCCAARRSCPSRWGTRSPRRRASQRSALRLRYVILRRSRPAKLIVGGGGCHESDADGAYRRAAAWLRRDDERGAGL